MATREAGTTGRKKFTGTSFKFLLLLLLVTACNSPYTPKPTGYYTIEFPKKEYTQFNQAGYPYRFEYPAYARIVKDSTFFDTSAENPWWVNIDFPQFNARIYLSYKVVGNNSLDKLLNDAYNLTNKHSIKASYINDSVMNIAPDVHGSFFSVQGDVATASQFFLTDSTKHFIRGALYFDATPNEDSLRPVNQFLVDDMKHLINSLRWK